MGSSRAAGVASMDLVRCAVVPTSMISIRPLRQHKSCALQDRARDRRSCSDASQWGRGASACDKRAPCAQRNAFCTFSAIQPLAGLFCHLWPSGGGGGDQAPKIARAHWERGGLMSCFDPEN